MITPFEEIKDSARIWIYQSDRVLTEQDQKLIKEKASAFITSWAAHGQDLLASATILLDYFLVIAADEDFNMASGCSIDNQFRFVQDLAQELSIDFFNRMNIAFIINQETKLISMSDLKGEVAAGNISPSTTFFDNNINSKGQLNEEWQKTAGDSWLSRYFKAQKNVI